MKSTVNLLFLALAAVLVSLSFGIADVAAGPGKSAAPTKQNPEEKAAVEAIKKLGGQVRQDDKGYVIMVDLSDTTTSDADLRHMRQFPYLEELELDETRVTNAGLQSLVGLERLEQLDLDETQVSDEGLTHLTKMSALRELDVGDTKVTDAGVAKLKASLPKLKVNR